MKLVYIAASRMPTEKGYGYQIAKMCEAFAALGVEVELLYPKRENPIKQDIFDFYNLKKNFKATEIPSFDALHGIPFLGKISFWISSIFYVNALKKASIHKDAVIYTRAPEIAELFSKRDYKTVFEIHSFPKSKIFLYKRFLSQVSVVVALTKPLKEKILELGINNGKAVVSGDAVDLNTFSIDMEMRDARARLSLPQDKKIIGYFGNFTTMGEDKGISSILKILSGTSEETIFLAVGGRKADIEKYSKDSVKVGLSNRAIFKERVSHTELAIYQKACDILLMPFPDTEHYRYYMSPLKMFEYMTAKRPIVTTDLPTIREVLDESTAVIVPPGNVEKLKEAVNYLLKNPEVGEKLALKAFEKVQEYTWTKRAEKIIGAIKK
jgi:glycosyltransferase involved in cell wall biosynthesis